MESQRCSGPRSEPGSRNGWRACSHLPPPEIGDKWNGDDDHHDGNYQAERAARAEIAHSPLDAKQYVDGAGRTARTAACRRLDHVVRAEGADQRDRYIEREGGREQRKGDPPESLPGARAVDPRSLVQFAGHRIDAGDVDERREADPLPGVHERDRWQRRRSVPEPGVMEPPWDKHGNEAVERSGGIEDAAPNIADGERRDQHREEEQRTKEAVEQRAFPERIGEAQADYVLHQHRDHRISDRYPDGVDQIALPIQQIEV